MSEPSCENCTYQDEGLCKRNPPVLLGVAQAQFTNTPVPVTAFLPTKPEQWCGEWKEKLQLQK